MCLECETGYYLEDGICVVGANENENSYPNLIP